MTEEVYPVLDTLVAPLQGVNLVEANAGTGKTFSIVSLYLRLLLENKLTVDQILVVSFTEAATAELRTRIRQRLSRLYRVFEQGEGEPEDLAYLPLYSDKVLVTRRIRRALQSFDQAAIFTIHGFCQRLLGDAAFEAGLAFRTELITDDFPIKQQIVEDFWHAESANAGTIWLNCLINEANPENLLDSLGRHFGRPMLQCLASDEPGIEIADEAALKDLSTQIKMAWGTCGAEVTTLLLDDPALNRNKFSQSTIEKNAVILNSWCQSSQLLPEKLSDLYRFGAKAVSTGAKKNKVPPEHVFFDQFQPLLDLGARIERIKTQKLSALRKRLLAFAYDELPRRKRMRRQRHFDDLLRDVYEVLQSNQASALRKAVKLQYSAALIDEFQDTDPLQFTIFKQLFFDNDAVVYFVGDPKQAIYSFRNADVYAYLKARDYTDMAYRLDANYRSVPLFVDSINSLFGKSANPFVIKEIHYHDSKAAKEIDGLLIDGVKQPVMNWWQIQDSDIAGLQGKKLDARVAESVASEIARMLQLISEGRLKKCDQSALQARDIAVLVNTHKQGQIVRDALERRGVACMQRTEESVLKTEEASELTRILHAVIEPGSGGLVRAALATIALGYDGAQIDELNQDDRAWQDILNKFSRYSELWKQHNFAYMLRRLMQDFDVETRLLTLPRGQRRLSNFRHLADLIQSESSRLHGRIEEVLAWMMQQKNKEGQIQEETLLRLDSDENLVNILTIHFSKGLQFDVVFCPFLWAASGPSKKPPVVMFHDQEHRPTLDLGTDQQEVHRSQEELERLSERVRLNYVALTRAKLACYSAWGVNKKGAKQHQPGLNWLLHYGNASQDLTKMKLPKSDSEVSDALKQITSPGVEVSPLPPAGTNIVSFDQGEGKLLAARKLKNSIAGGWRLTSFSALTAHSEVEARDYDAGKSVELVDPVEPSGIFAFPRGARAGRCIHSLFENISFSGPADEIRAVAKRVLALAGYESEFAETLTDMAANVLNCNLGSNDELYLRDLNKHQRVDEMEFYFPVSQMRASSLREALGDFGFGTPLEKRLEALNFRIREGFMHGFIDLVFEAKGRYYLVDYKSNWLGADRQSYQPAALAHEIGRHDYYLQYLIYSVALHRHLKLCLPDYNYEQHFGGAFYLFIRGMSAESGTSSGVYFDRPGFQLIQRLDKLFAGGGHE